MCQLGNGLVVLAHNDVTTDFHGHALPVFLTLFEFPYGFFVVIVGEQQTTLNEISVGLWCFLTVFGDVLKALLGLALQKHGFAPLKVSYRKVFVEVNANRHVILTLLIIF